MCGRGEEEGWWKKRKEKLDRVEPEDVLGRTCDQRSPLPVDTETDLRQ